MTWSNHARARVKTPGCKSGNDPILVMEHFDETRRRIRWSKNEFSQSLSPEPTAVGACRSAVAVLATSRRWLSTLGRLSVMPILILMFSICIAGCLEASEIKVTPLPATGVSERFGGVTNMDLVAVPKTVTAWRIIFASQRDGPPIVVTNRFTKPGPGILVPTNLVAQLTPILLDRRSYYPPEMHDNCIHQPDLLLTFSDGSKSLDVMFCMNCSIMMVSTKEGGFETVDSLITGAASTKLSHIIQQIFPNEDAP